MAPLVLGLIALGCGGSGSAPPAGAGLRLTASSSVLKVQGQTRVTATDGTGAPVAASLQVLDAGGGTVDAQGRYTAPSTPGTYRIQARAGGALAEAAVLVEAYRAALTVQPGLAASRSSATASRLPDGSILVVGGLETSRAERYLPAAGAFVDAGDTGLKRWAHTATDLPGGGVLVAGGQGVTGTLASATLFQDGSFATLAAALASPRYGHQATALSDGRVLVTGGLPLTGSDVRGLAACEAFDPAQRRFVAVAPMGLPRAGHTATALKDGRILVTGGRDSTCFYTCSPQVWSSAEVYDPATDTWTPAGAMAQARHGHTATLLPDGRVLLAGGTTPDLAGTDVSSLIEVWDPATAAFQVVGTLLRPRSEHTATLLGDGAVLLAGGLTYGEGTLATATAEAFDPSTRTSRLATSGLTTRYRHAAARLDAGPVLLVGGSEGGGGLKHVERFE